MPPPRWIVLGSGGGEATPDRASAGHLLETPETLMLFDCGDGVTGAFLRAGKRVEDLDAVLISHTHPDHICGLSFFLQQMYLAVRRRELVIYLPSEAISGIRSYLELCYLFLERFPFPVTFVPLADGRSLEAHHVTIIPRLNTHLTRHRGQPWMAGLHNQGECYSFDIRRRSTRVVYSADVGAIADLAFCADADVLVAETTHLQTPDLIEQAKRWRVKHLVLAHLGPEFDFDAVARSAMAYPGRLTVARDGLSISLND